MRERPARTVLVRLRTRSRTFALPRRTFTDVAAQRSSQQRRESHRRQGPSEGCSRRSDSVHRRATVGPPPARAGQPRVRGCGAMSAATRIRRPHLTTVLRDDGRVSPLELFFDLVFVLALTQCTALMADEPTWTGLAKGVAVLAVLWWSWVGYAWLTSVVDPEEGFVRLAMFAAM